MRWVRSTLAPRSRRQRGRTVIGGDEAREPLSSAELRALVIERDAWREVVGICADGEWEELPAARARWERARAQAPLARERDLAAVAAVRALGIDVPDDFDPPSRLLDEAARVAAVGDPQALENERWKWEVLQRGLG